jgi:hypothetical protein
MKLLPIQLGLAVVITTHAMMLNAPGSRSHALLNLAAAASISFGLFM